MKKLCLAFSVLMLLTACFTAYYQSVSNAFVRFHIIAESNSPYDQLVKINLRNTVLSSISDGLSRCEKKEEALAFLSENSQKIKNLSDDYLRSIGYDKTTEVALTKEYYPLKEYSDFTLPYGKYDSFKITIGSGKGKNFFCVMFPPVCVSEEMTQKVEDILNSKKIIYKFKLFDKELRL